MAEEGLNKVMLLGRLGADPELRMTPSGQAVLKMRLATTENYLDRNKVKQERTEWHTATLWGKRAESLAKILSKGDRIHLEGKLQTRSYDAKDGTKRYTTEVNVNNVILCGGGRGGGSREAADENKSEPSGGGGGYADEDYSPSAGDDDIPFSFAANSARESWWR